MFWPDLRDAVVSAPVDSAPGTVRNLREIAEEAVGGVEVLPEDGTLKPKPTTRVRVCDFSDFSAGLDSSSVPPIAMRF